MQATKTSKYNQRLLTVPLHAYIREPLLHQKVSTILPTMVVLDFTTDLFSVPRSLKALWPTQSFVSIPLFATLCVFACANTCVYPFVVGPKAECKWLALQPE